MNKWIIYCFVGMFNIACLVLILKHLTNSIPEQVIMFFIMGIATIGFLIHSIYTNSMGQIGYNINLFLLIIAGILSYIGNLYWLKGLKYAPNPGYAMAIFDIRTIVVAIGAYIIFSNELSLIKFLGIIICIFGARLVTL